MKRFAFRYPALLLFLGVVLVTRPYFFADTYEYTHAVAAYEQGRADTLFEFGHLFWRPIGYVLQSIFHPLLSLFVGPSIVAQTTLVLIALVFTLTLLGIFCLYKLLRNLHLSETPVHAAVAMYVVSQVIVNFSRTGTSYVAGVSLVVIGMYFVLRESDRVNWKDQWIGAAAVAMAVMVWFTYALALPAVVLARPLLYGANKISIRNAFILGLAISCHLLVGYGIAIFDLHLFSREAFLIWFTSAEHNNPMTGIPRMIFGLPKVLFYVGQDGLYIKRFMMHDPYNPVSFNRLLGLGLWKVVLFYTMLLGILIVLIRDKKWNVIFLTFVGFVPMLCFSSVFDGAAIERHLPLFPFLIIAFAFSFDVASEKIRNTYMGVITIIMLVNIIGMWRPTVNAYQRQTEHEITAIEPKLEQNAMIYVLGIHDELIDFARVFPFNPISKSETFISEPLVHSGSDSARFWLQAFEAKSKQCWNIGAQVWVSRKLLAPRPSERDYWIENQDSGVTWKSISSFFNQQHYTDSTPDFLLLKRP